MADQLTEAILGGRIQTDLPSEKDLASSHGVSRVTVRRALGLLAEAGLVEVTWGRGWSVTGGPLSEPANTLLSVTELAAERQLSVHSRVLRAEIRPAGLDVAEQLGMAPGARLFVLDRVRLHEGTPFARQLCRIVADRVPGIEDLDFSERSLYESLERHWGICPTRADYAVEARPADDDHAEHLGVESGSPLLWATQETYDQHGQVIETGWSAYPWDRYRFRATLTRPAPLAEIPARRTSSPGSRSSGRPNAATSAPRQKGH